MKRKTQQAIDILVKKLEESATDDVWLYLEDKYLNDVVLTIAEARKDKNTMRYMVFEQCMPNAPQSLTNKPILHALRLENVAKHGYFF